MLNKGPSGLPSCWGYFALDYGLEKNPVQIEGQDPVL